MHIYQFINICLDIIINNAGVALDGDLVDVSYEEMEWLMGINFWGMVYGTKAFLPYLKKSGDGHICNVSSIFGFMAPAGTVQTVPPGCASTAT